VTDAERPGLAAVLDVNDLRATEGNEFCLVCE
jgi:hypothetical protein